MKKEERILRNSIKTPDGTILESRHVHDYVSHTDKNGRYYAVDGGNSYFRRSFEVKDFEDLSIIDDGKHSTRIKYLKWGANYDKDMNRLPKTVYKTIETMDTDHIEAIVNGGWCRNEFYLKVFKKELKNRSKNKE